jgi:hypothetical protein
VPLAIVENAKYVVILKEFVVIGDGCGHCAWKPLQLVYKNGKCVLVLFPCIWLGVYQEKSGILQGAIRDVFFLNEDNYLQRDRQG